MDIATVKQRQQAAWASGDYAAVGARLLLTAELLCEAVDLRAGQQVLDVACGNGNAALAAARRFCQVTGVDYVPALLDRARQRAAAEGLQATFQDADAEALPFPDNSFDAVLSTCGAMFAPDQERTAAELLRVCRPGGRIGMVNWTPDSYVGELFRAIGRHLPPPPGLRPPVLWGSPERLRELFGPEVTISAPRRTFLWRFPSAEHQAEFLRHLLRSHQQGAGDAGSRPRRRPQGRHAGGGQELRHLRRRHPGPPPGIPGGRHPQARDAVAEGGAP
jgi:SAM-dependent methyltransferase